MSWADEHESRERFLSALELADATLVDAGGNGFPCPTIIFLGGLRCNMLGGHASDALHFFYEGVRKWGRILLLLPVL